MDTSLQAEHRPFAGLFFRAGSRSWFWGLKRTGKDSWSWGTTRPARKAEEAIAETQKPGSDAEMWPGLADWLRRMHAQAALLPPQAANREE